MVAQRTFVGLPAMLLVATALILLTTSQLTLAIKDSGGIVFETSVGDITATLKNGDAGRKLPPQQCRYYWELAVPGFKGPVELCFDDLFNFLENYRGSGGPPATGQ